MRIVFISLKHDPGFGGGSSRGLDLKMRELQRRGHEVRLITIYSEMNRLPEGLPYPVHEERCQNRAFLPLQKFVFGLMKKHESQADIFHLDGVSFIWAGGIFRQNGGTVPVVVFLSSYLFAMNLLSIESPYNKTDVRHYLFMLIHYKHVALHFVWAKIFGLKLIRHIDQIIAISPITAYHFIRFGFPKEKMKIIAEFVDLEPFGYTKETHIGSSEVDCKLLYLGRLVYLKGLDMLIRALRDLRKDGFKLRLTIIGGGPQELKLKRQIQRYKLNDTIIIIPWTQNFQALADAYRSCDIFIHPCRWPEPFGRTILEAMAFGKPIITWKDTGSAWVAGDAAITYARPKTYDIRECLRTCLMHPELLRNASKTASTRITHFDFHKWADELENSLELLVKKAKNT
jgi:glycosyltransferase involved in cell wall biosynthesis